MLSRGISGNNPRYCKYFDLLDRIFSGDPAIQPQDLACSLRVRVMREDEEEQQPEDQGGSQQFVPVEDLVEAGSSGLGGASTQEESALVDVEHPHEGEERDKTMISLNLVPVERDDMGEGAALSGDGMQGGLLARSSTPAPLGAQSTTPTPAVARRTPTPTLPLSRSGTTTPSTSADRGTTRAASRPTPVERIAKAKARKRRVSALTDVAWELV